MSGAGHVLVLPVLDCKKKKKGKRPDLYRYVYNKSVPASV